MKRYLILLTVLLYTLVAYSQNIEFGMRDNQYARIDYVDKKSWLVGFEQSILNVKAQEQSGRLFCGYQFYNNIWKIDGVAYIGTEYSGKWNVVGALFNTSVDYNKLGASLSINPNKDSGFDIQMNYNVEGSYNVWNNKNDALRYEKLDICASFGNIPEFRDNNKNLRVGLIFKSGNLWVKPTVCIPGIAEDDFGEGNVRVLFNMGWKLKMNKSKM